MEILYYFSGYIFFAVLLVKVLLHIYLDSAHGYRIAVATTDTWQYLMPYEKEVLDSFKRQKAICNVLQRLTIAFLILTVILIILKNIF